MLAILGHFSRFSPDDHLDICFSGQQNFTESTLLLYILRYLYFKAQYPENRKNGHNMHQNGHIWYFLAIFIAGTFWPLSVHASWRMDALISPILKYGEGFIAQKMTKN